MAMEMTAQRLNQYAGQAREGAVRYRRLAALAVSEEARTMLLLLAHEEQRYARLFSVAYQKRTGRPPRETALPAAVKGTYWTLLRECVLAESGLCRRYAREYHHVAQGTWRDFFFQAHGDAAVRAMRLLYLLTEPDGRDEETERKGKGEQPDEGWICESGGGYPLYTGSGLSL